MDLVILDYFYENNDKDKIIDIITVEIRGFRLKGKNSEVQSDVMLK